MHIYNVIMYVCIYNYIYIYIYIYISICILYSTLTVLIYKI